MVINKSTEELNYLLKEIRLQIKKLREDLEIKITDLIEIRLILEARQIKKNNSNFDD